MGWSSYLAGNIAEPWDAWDTTNLSCPTLVSHRNTLINNEFPSRGTRGTPKYR